VLAKSPLKTKLPARCGLFFVYPQKESRMESHGPERMNAQDGTGVSVSKLTSIAEAMQAHGRFEFKCAGPPEDQRARYCELRDLLEGLTDEQIAADPIFSKWLREFKAIPIEEKWADTIDNLVVTVGKNLALDTLLSGSSYTVTGPYLGLTQASPTPALGDTMASHSGWSEAGGANAPTYTAPRKTISFSAASGGTKASTGVYTYAITSSGTVGGGFLVYGAGAVSTIDNTAGTLLSCGAFTQGNKVVGNGDAVTVTYSLAM
jgi:hypothetical protein